MHHDQQHEPLSFLSMTGITEEFCTQKASYISYHKHYNQYIAMTNRVFICVMEIIKWNSLTPQDVSLSCLRLSDDLPCIQWGSSGLIRIGLGWSPAVQICAQQARVPALHPQHCAERKEQHKGVNTRLWEVRVLSISKRGLVHVCVGPYVPSTGPALLLCFSSTTRSMNFYESWCWLWMFSCSSGREVVKENVCPKEILKTLKMEKKWK